MNTTNCLIPQMVHSLTVQDYINGSQFEVKWKERPE